MRIFTLGWLAISSLVLPACSLSKSEKKDDSTKKPAAEAPELVGRIALIPAGKRFVLIQSYGSWKIETGSILTTYGLNERTANLLVTGEALGQFAAADIQSGSVEIGDAVYFRHIPKPSETSTNASPESKSLERQQHEQNKNVQKNN